MQQWADTLAGLFEDPAQNAAAIGTGVAVVVVFALIIVLLLVAFALPSTRVVLSGSASESTSGRRRHVPPWITALLVATLVVAMATAAVLLWYQDTSTNEYCTKTCHAMAIPAETWTISAHSEVECIRCHEGRKWESFTQGIALRIDSLYMQWTDASPRGRQVPNSICLSCHESVLSRTVTGRNGEDFKHSAIDAKRTSCADCHGPQGHTTPRP